MPSLPYMQLYVSDYLADTSHLNAAQHGAYLLLLMNYWQRGKPLPDSNDRLATVARMSSDEWTTHRGVLVEFFSLENGCWIHARVERDLRKAGAISRAGKIAGMASAKARKERALNDRPKIVERDSNHKDKDKDKDNKEQLPTGKVAEQGNGLPEWLPFEAWNGFVESRRKMKKPLTDRAKVIAIKTLEKHKAEGYDPEFLLDTAVAKCWLGIYIPKGEDGKPIKPKKLFTVVTSWDAAYADAEKTLVTA